ncbi:MAG: LppX_LprAFG lipoprotein [Chloroflexota bacterium]
MDRNRARTMQLIAAGALAFLLGACGGATTASPTAAPTAPAATPDATTGPTGDAPTASPAEATPAASEGPDPIGALADLDSYKLALTIASENVAGGIAAMGDISISGTFVRRPEAAADLVLAIGESGQALEMRIVEIGGKTYVDMGGGLTEGGASQSSLVSSFSPDKLLGGFSTYTPRMQVVGDETKNGVATTHLTATPELMAEAASSLSSLGLDDATWSWDVWIAKDGGYAVSYVMEGRGTGDASMAISMDLTDANSPSNIVEAP